MFNCFKPFGTLAFVSFDCLRANKMYLKAFGSAGTPHPLWKKLIFEPSFWKSSLNDSSRAMECFYFFIFKHHVLDAPGWLTKPNPFPPQLMGNICWRLCGPGCWERNKNCPGTWTQVSRGECRQDGPIP